MSKSSEKRDPDEIILTRHGREELQRMISDGAKIVTTGEPERIPVFGYVGQPLTSEDEEDEGPLPYRTEAELDEIFDEDAFDYDGSIESQILCNQTGWHDLCELRGAVFVSPPSASRDHALKLIDRLEGWFERKDEQLINLLAGRDKDGGAS